MTKPIAPFTLTLSDLAHVTGGARKPFDVDSVQQPGFSFIRAGRRWKNENDGSVVGRIGANQKVRINGDHATVDHGRPFAGGHHFIYDGAGWKYNGSDR